MSLTLTPMTELDAVNAILSSVGDAPVNDFNLPQAARARQQLHNTSREVQQEAEWEFNSEEDVNLIPGSDGYIQLAQNTLRVSSKYNRELTHRGSRLYDRQNRRFTFDDAQKVDVIYFIQWSDLPSTARSYITVRAARKFQRDYIGSSELAAISEEDEMKALMAFRNDEAKDRRASIFDGSPSLWKATKGRIL